MKKTEEEELTESLTSIKHHNRMLLPMNSSLEIMTHRHMLHQEVGNNLGLPILQPQNLLRELLVVENCLLAGDRVDTNERVSRDDWVAANSSTNGFSERDEIFRGVDGADFLDHLLPGRRKSLVRLSRICNHRVTSNVGTSENAKHNVSGGLTLVTDIVMPKARA